MSFWTLWIFIKITILTAAGLGALTGLITPSYILGLQGFARFSFWGFTGLPALGLTTLGSSELKFAGDYGARIIIWLRILIGVTLPLIAIPVIRMPKAFVGGTHFVFSLLTASTTMLFLYGGYKRWEVTR